MTNDDQMYLRHLEQALEAFACQRWRNRPCAGKGRTMNHETLMAQGPVDVTVRGYSAEDAQIDALQNAATEITGLCEVLCSQLQETIGAGDFKSAQKLAWSYDCLATLAEKLARELSDATP
jgi:hypothetical protein